MECGAEESVHRNIRTESPGEIPDSRGQEGENNWVKIKIVRVLIGREMIFGFPVLIIDHWVGACGKLWAQGVLLSEFLGRGFSLGKSPSRSNPPKKPGIGVREFFLDWGQLCSFQLCWNYRNIFPNNFTSHTTGRAETWKSLPHRPVFHVLFSQEPGIILPAPLTW